MTGRSQEWVGVGADAAKDAADQLDSEALSAIGLAVGRVELTASGAPADARCI